MRGKRRIAKLKRKRQRQGTGLKAGRVAETRKAVQARTEKRLKQTKELIDDSLPVAPDEPTYCYCNDVSYGEMIACENEVFWCCGDANSSFVRRSGFTWDVRV